MAYVKVKCKQCGGYAKINIGDCVEDAKNTLSSMKMNHCVAGNGCNISGSFIENNDILWNQMTEDEVATEDEFLRNLKAMYKEVLGVEEFFDKYKKESVLYDSILATPRGSDDEVSYMFNHIITPKGEVYYCRL